MRHRLAKSAAAVLLLFMVAAGGMLLAWSAGLLRSSFIRFVSWQSNRPIDVRGALHLHLLTSSPRVEAEQVTIGNPPWTQPGITAEIAKLTLTFASLLSHHSGFSLIEIDGAHLQFRRDGAGHANWQRVDPDQSPGGPLPMIGALTLTQSHLTLVDERLHLDFEGDLSIDGRDSAQPLQVQGSGTLNGRAVTFRLKGDALRSAAADKPYSFEFDESSSGTHFTAQGTLPKPFDLGLVEARFDARGADLRDLFYLLGVSLPNTGSFHLHGRIVRRDDETLLDDLNVVSGQSDVSGRVSLRTPIGGRTLVHADLHSEVLRLADIGLRVAGRDPHPDAPPQLFSAVPLITPVTRRVDANGTYSARRLLLSRLEVTELSAPFTMQHGLIRVPNVTGHLMGGNIVLALDTDANQTPARTRIELTLMDLQLAQMTHTSEPPPYEGLLLVKIHAEGVGDSLHALAADADGNLNAQLAQGTLRASLAELAGVDLRGLGLTLTASRRDVAVRCAAADFDVHSGVMHARRLFIDSEPVFISGEGRILLDSETVDLKLHGEPKRLRILRVKAPLLVQGTLLQPKFSVDVAASGFRLLDYGTPHDAECAKLLPR